MRNYRRHSGDGSAKVVLSGDSNSPPKTTPRREPPPYNSSPTQGSCTSISALIFHPNTHMNTFEIFQAPKSTSLLLGYSLSAISYFSSKKARESAKVHVSLRPLLARKVDFLVSHLLGYWLLAIGYFSLRPATAYPAKHPGASHVACSEFL